MDSFIRITGCFVLAFSLSHSAFAAKTIPYQTRPPQPEYLSSFVNSGVIQYPVSFETRAVTPTSPTLAAQNITRYTTRPVPLTVARAASMARTVVATAGGPVGFTLSAALIAGSFIIEDGEVIQQQESVGDTADWWLSQSIFGGAQRYIPFASKSAIDSGIANYLTQSGFCYQSHTVTTNTSNSYALNVVTYRYNAGCTGLNQTGTITFLAQNNTTCPAGHAAYPDGNCHPTTNPPRVPVSDDVLVDTIVKKSPNAIPQLVDDVVRSGKWPEMWPEMEPVRKNIEDQLGHDLEGGPAPVIPDETISDSSTVNAPQPQPTTGTTATEWPGFCSWAGVVCDFIDWFKDELPPPEIPEMPTEEIQPVEWESGLGSGSCPANPVTSFNGETIEYDLTNACWGASTIFKPILLVLSLIGAAYIIVGARS